MNGSIAAITGISVHGPVFVPVYVDRCGEKNKNTGAHGLHPCDADAFELGVDFHLPELAFDLTAGFFGVLLEPFKDLIRGQFPNQGFHTRYAAGGVVLVLGIGIMPDDEPDIPVVLGPAVGTRPLRQRKRSLNMKGLFGHGKISKKRNRSNETGKS